jgi:hypothetical protein
MCERFYSQVSDTGVGCIALWPLKGLTPVVVDGDGVHQVFHGVWPVARHEDRLTRELVQLHMRC